MHANLRYRTLGSLYQGADLTNEYLSIENAAVRTKEVKPYAATSDYYVSCGWSNDTIAHSPVGSPLALQPSHLGYVKVIRLTGKFI